jgi:hypothetical protein
MKEWKQNEILWLIENAIIACDKDGSVFNLKMNRKLKGCLNPFGYPITTLKFTHADITVHATIHSIVWIFFQGKIPKGLQINHIDGDKKNNRLKNL